MKVSFIGCGNMAKAMIEGVLAQKLLAPEDIQATTKHPESAQKASEELGIKVHNDNLAAVREADIVFLAVKPYLYEETIASIRDEVTADKLLVSVAPAKTLAWMQEQVGRPTRIIRTAPNTPAKVRAGLTGYCPNENATEQDVANVVAILESFGKAIEAPEKLMDVIATVGGSSPAFVYMFIEALADGGVAEGLTRQQALEVSAQAVLGAAKMVLESGEHPGALKDKVCSPAGSTIQGVEALEMRGYRGTITSAIRLTTQAARNL